MNGVSDGWRSCGSWATSTVDSNPPYPALRQWPKSEECLMSGLTSLSERMSLDAGSAASAGFLSLGERPLGAATIASSPSSCYATGPSLGTRSSEGISTAVLSAIVTSMRQAVLKLTISLSLRMAGLRFSLILEQCAGDAIFKRRRRCAGSGRQQGET